jgi:hypothetical protein
MPDGAFLVEGRNDDGDIEFRIFDFDFLMTG